MPQVIRVTDETNRDEIAEALTNLGRSAARLPHVVGNAQLATPWDRMHGRIDAMLDDWLAAQA